MRFGLPELIVIFVVLVILALIIAVIVLAVYFLSRRNTQAAGASSGAGRVPCPFCAELILPEAKVCRFCGRELPAQYKLDQ